MRKGNNCNGQGRIMHELKASALSARDRYIMPESTNNPVMTANWCLTNLVLLTGLKQR